MNLEQVETEQFIEMNLDLGVFDIAEQEIKLSSQNSNLLANENMVDLKDNGTEIRTTKHEALPEIMVETQTNTKPMIEELS